MMFSLVKLNYIIMSGFIWMLGLFSTMPRPSVCQFKVRYVVITFPLFGEECVCASHRAHTLDLIHENFLPLFFSGEPNCNYCFKLNSILLRSYFAVRSKALFGWPCFLVSDMEAVENSTQKRHYLAAVLASRRL